MGHSFYYFSKTETLDKLICSGDLEMWQDLRRSVVLTNRMFTFSSKPVATKAFYTHNQNFLVVTL